MPLKNKHTIILCLGSSCFARGNHLLIEPVKRFLLKNQLEDKIEFKGGHCCNECNEGPVMLIDGKAYHNVTKENFEEILGKALGNT